MPLPGWLARTNRRLTNHVLAPLARRSPYLGVVVHRGRKSGRTYRTPVNVFPDGGTFVFSLTYGAEVDWLKNVMAAGECELVHRGRTLRLVRPHLEGPGMPSAIPTLVRFALDRLEVDQFLRMDR
ncbi:MAG: nitroreductase family deazaflavin-dependent oxidoreductase [Actinomycetota bacterium]|nr:nitroreductase family deazaflavin-dependent oxidoreductase [Actinomycetota bacterium]